MDKWRVDEFYEATVLRFSRLLATVSAGVDKYVVDAGLTKLTALAVRGAGFASTRVQNGLVQAYAAAMVAGVLAAAWWFTVPHIELTVTAPAEAPSDSDLALRGQPGARLRVRVGLRRRRQARHRVEPRAQHLALVQRQGVPAGRRGRRVRARRLRRPVSTARSSPWASAGRSIRVRSARPGSARRRTTRRRWSS